MDEIRFHVIVGDDQVIRPPLGLALPEGEVEVTVRKVPATPVSDDLAPTRDWLLAMAEQVEMIAPPLPADLALNHDHYAHGKPRP